MTERGRRFVEEYLIDLNATQAAIRAGYSEKTARQSGERLLTNVDIRAAVDARLAQIHDERTADAKEVIEFLTAVMRGEVDDEALRLVNGEQVKINMGTSVKDRVRAAELLGKRHRLFDERMKVDVVAPVVICGAEALED